MEPRVETVDLRLIGVQAVFMNIAEEDFCPALRKLWERLLAKFDQIPHRSSPERLVGYWHTVDGPTKLYFAGVLVDRIGGEPRGLHAWDLGETAFAIFPEKNGEEGSVIHGGHAWRWLNASEYAYHHRLIGDLEVWSLESYRQARADPPSGSHEVWVPVRRKDGP